MIVLMIRELDHQAEAIAAMQKAIAATCPAERFKWLQAAVAWRQLASLAKGKLQREVCSQAATTSQAMGLFR